MDVDLERQAKTLEQSGDYRVLRRLKPFSKIHEDSEVKKLKGVVLDVETTGTESRKDKIIELAMVVFSFSSDGRIFEILETYRSFEDPQQSISQEITDLTGITDEDVKDQKIDDEKVASLMEDVVLVIAHNAGFDRPFMEARFALFENVPWACSQKQIPWSKEGVTGLKLEFIAQVYGFFYGAHRAMDDVWAVLKILSSDLPKSGTLVLSSLLVAAREPTHLVSATHAPFDKKDILKERRYKWNPHGRVWETEILESDLDEETKFLREVIYENNDAVITKAKMTAKRRFSRRK
jgi:DNA polymerase-3 subunit epsilon